MRNNKTVFFSVALALGLPVLLIAPLLFGCQSGTTGLFRPLSASAEKSITNTIVIASGTAATAVGAPYSAAIEGAAAAVLALLAAWQASTHSKLNKLETTVANGKPPPKI